MGGQRLTSVRKIAAVVAVIALAGLCFMFLLYLREIHKINASYLMIDEQESTVALRRFPYPFKAALTINSDIDGTTTKEEFAEIQRFLNTTDETPMGKGVGLEIGNSFIMSAPSKCCMSYYAENAGNDQFIAQLIGSGVIDVIHSFSEYSDFTRSDAQRAIGDLKKSNLHVDVWVDHSKSFNNLGNDVTLGYGADPDSKGYHADLTTNYGISFAWLGRVTMIAGQSVPLTVSTFLDIYDGEHPYNSLVNISKELTKNVLGVYGSMKYLHHRDNELVKVTTLRDGSRVYEFTRFDNYWKGVGEGANGKNLASAISERTLRLLKESKGYMIVYTHLGYNNDCKYAICDETASALRLLSDEYNSGNVLVMSTSKLLHYYTNHRYLKWSYDMKDDRINIHISRVEDPLSYLQELTEYELQGITFYVPSAKNAHIYLGGREVTNVSRNRADETGRESVMIPLTFFKN